VLGYTITINIVCVPLYKQLYTLLTVYVEGILQVTTWTIGRIPKDKAPCLNGTSARSWTGPTTGVSNFPGGLQDHGRCSVWFEI
jgi:hypothetical protein